MERLDLAITFALRSFSLDLGLSVGSETVALVGPSGAGKTTVLRAVAGLRRPDRGRITLGDRPWFDAARRIDLAPEERSVGLVFQEYALFPHMTVRANVAFGGGARVDDLLERFHIVALAGEKPAALSGGERQRVALARALARDPAVLLLDEPLAALDAHTRHIVRDELQELLGELALPALLVTHDFRDAAALADRIGVIVAGQLRQLGTADELVDDPADPFVVSLTGGNLLTGSARPLRVGGSEVLLDNGATVRADERASGRVGVAVYPWEISVRPAGDEVADDENAILAPIAAMTPEEGRIRVRIGPLTAEAPRAELERIGLRRGDLACACFSTAHTRLLALADGVALPDLDPALTQPQ
jgi:ABC-type sulfate/molybdate transport systems ATPase subunit